MAAILKLMLPVKEHQEVAVVDITAVAAVAAAVDTEIAINI